MDQPTYRVSVHETDTPRISEHGGEPGWVLVEQAIPLMGLRAVVRSLWDDGYEDDAILVERET